MNISYRDNLDKKYGHLESGRSYRVAVRFEDFDHTIHPVGEIWLFIGSNFVPYDDGLSLFASINGTEEQVRLQHRPEEQGNIISNLSKYLILID